MEILYVDDDIDDVEMFVEAVHCVDANINCRHAYTTSDALHQLINNSPKPDGIFVDFHLQVAAGMNACRQSDPMTSSRLFRSF